MLMRGKSKDEGIRQKDVTDRFWHRGEALHPLPLDCVASNKIGGWRELGKTDMATPCKTKSHMIATQ